MGIKESKEYKLAKDWEMSVNNYGFNPKRFAAAIPEKHPTLQQSLARRSKVHHGISQGKRKTHPIKITSL